MMSSQQNDTITRVGKGTPAGQLLRRYWQPVALVEELPAERPVKAVRLMGQDFVVFKDEQGRYGMLDRDCPHRGADLAAGRLEGGGLRCAFHGWLFDASGRCLSTPGEPVGSTLCNKVRQSAYPIIEKAGVLFGYIGKDEPPAFPTSIASPRPMPTRSHSRDSSNATGYRRSKSVSIRRMRRFCIAFSKMRT
ncbi:protein of unknown function (plasmid) [Caballeronia sp. S22]